MQQVVEEFGRSNTASSKRYEEDSWDLSLSLPSLEQPLHSTPKEKPSMCTPEVCSSSSWQSGSLTETIEVRQDDKMQQVVEEFGRSNTASSKRYEEDSWDLSLSLPSLTPVKDNRKQTVLVFAFSKEVCWRAVERLGDLGRKIVQEVEEYALEARRQTVKDTDVEQVMKKMLGPAAAIDPAAINPEPANTVEPEGRQQRPLKRRRRRCLDKAEECSNCHTESTSKWRNGPNDSCLCQSCYMWPIQHNGAQRDPALRSDVIKRRKRRRCQQENDPVGNNNKRHKLQK